MRIFVSSSLRRFLRDRRAVSAIEFAIWAPIMILIFLGSIDITRYAMATGRLSDVAGTMGQMLSVNTLGTVNYVDLQFYHDSAMITYPQVLLDAAQQNIAWSNDMAITMTSVTFTPTPSGCSSNCTYVPKVLWSYGTNQRSCKVTMTSASDSSQPSAGTLPADVFGPTSLLVVDIVYVFRPLFNVRPLPGFPAFGNIAITRSFYTAPRYVTSVGYQVIGGDPGSTTVCPSS